VGVLAFLQVLPTVGFLSHGPPAAELESDDDPSDSEEEIPGEPDSPPPAQTGPPQMTDSLPLAAFSQCPQLQWAWVPNWVESLSEECFAKRQHLEIVTFFASSTVVRIGAKCFSQCRPLMRICIPTRVRKLCRRCFEERGALASVEFEAGSQLRRIEPKAFRKGPRLDVIDAPRASGCSGGPS
jgi:hypothetical protein